MYFLVSLTNGCSLAWEKNSQYLDTERLHSLLSLSIGTQEARLSFLDGADATTGATGLAGGLATRADQNTDHPALLAPPRR